MIIPTIMCGGAGTRLWPASRDSLPKHLIAMFDGLSTFQLTLQRFHKQPGFGRPVVITSADSRFMIAQQLADIGVEADLILEPSRQDSAAAVAIGALHLAARKDDSICLILAADHKIADVEAFRAACRLAATSARQGHIMTLGITPTFASVGYGYIRPGASMGGSFTLKEFREKPDSATAAKLIAEGCLWNSGNFMFQPQTMLDELQTFAPDILKPTQEAYAKAVRDADFIRLDADTFKTVKKTSIDYAVMERTTKAGVTPFNGGWSDIGTWDALWDASERDGDGNVLSGDVSVMGTRGSFIQSEGMLTTAIGLEDMVVVATRDAVLVVPRSRSDEVKELVAKLRADKRREADEHLRMYRPWGWYQRIDIGDRFQVKRIHVIPGGRLSLQKHFHRAEHWVVIKGVAEVTVDKDVAIVRENESIHLPLGCVHRMVNPGKIALEIIEVQIGSYTGEDDIVRIEDIYGR